MKPRIWVVCLRSDKTPHFVEASSFKQSPESVRFFNGARTVATYDRADVEGFSVAVYDHRPGSWSVRSACDLM